MNSSLIFFKLIMNSFFNHEFHFQLKHCDTQTYKSILRIYWNQMAIKVQEPCFHSWHLQLLRPCQISQLRRLECKQSLPPSHMFEETWYLLARIRSWFIQHHVTMAHDKLFWNESDEAGRDVIDLFLIGFFPSPSHSLHWSQMLITGRQRENSLYPPVTMVNGFWLAPM